MERFKEFIVINVENIKNHKCVKVTRSKCKDKFNFTKVPFIYDPDDYFYIPGLYREFDIGFLTPVYFNKEVLIKFDNRPDYRVSFASKTYGEIRKNDDFSISFGINDSDKVIMWLGDIAKLPLNEQYYLRSENIDSNHRIGKETLKHIEKLNPPVVHSSKEETVISLLNKINVESLDNKTLGDLLNNMGRNNKDISGILSPLFIIYNLRVVNLHLISTTKKAKVIESVRSRLGILIDKTSFVEIYKVLISKTTQCYKELVNLKNV